MTPHLPSDLTYRHGFFGRRGGVSEGVYECLNTGLGSNDNPDHVMENRRRVAETLGVQQTHLISNTQIHSAHVEIITDPPDKLREADGLVTDRPGLALSVLSADCAPVLFEDRKARIIGACHAGWRGAAKGIVESTVAAMCEIGASPQHIQAVIGPCISQANYEVQTDFLTEFETLSGPPDPFIQRDPQGKVHFDLPAFVLSRLQACGVGQMSWVNICTYALDGLYFSYRRNTHQGLTGYGRNISAIVLP